jgi:hypothetical protein
MDNGSKDPDRDILKPRKAFWADDPDENLTEAELDRVLRHFSKSANASDPQLRFSVKMQFQTFIVMAVEERFRELNGRLKKVSKPSTRVKREIQQLRKAGEKFYRQFANLDSVTKTWLGQHFEATGSEDESNGRDQFRRLDDRLFGMVQDLVLAARSAEGLTSSGPNNTALRVMIENLAQCWEICHGKPPTTDKGRGRQDDPFLEFCQEMARIADARL